MPGGNITDSQGHVHGTHNFVHNKDVAVVFFVFCSCGIGALLLHVGKAIHLPYTVLLLVIGILFGFIASSSSDIHQYAVISEVDPHLLLHIFLPILIFESAFAMEAHTFNKSFYQVLIVAVPGLGVASFLTCLMALYLFSEYNWGWNVCMMFGCVLSATDPVAVVALLRELGTSKQLAMLIEGESLLNDGAAIVLFNVFQKLVSSSDALKGGEIVLYLLQVAVGGPAFGYIMARLTLFWLSCIFNEALSEITITLASTYMTYYIGEVFLNVSGVLAVVVLGVVVSAGKANISPEVEVFLHRFWEVLAYLANTLIFILVGLVIQEKAIQPGEMENMDLFYLVVLYFGINVIRFLILGILLPILAHIGYGLSMKEMLVMTWSGVRGAVGLALALLVTQDPNITEHIKSKILIHVSGIVILTLLINGTTIKFLLKLLGMSDVSQPKRMAMASAVRHLQDRREKSLNILKTSRFLADADWEFVEKTSDIIDPYQTSDKEANLDGSLDLKVTASCPDCHACLPPNPSAKELKEMKKEAMLRMLKAERMSYRRQFVNGMLSKEAVRKLKECAEVAMDKAIFIDINDIKGCWRVSNRLIRMKRLLKKWSQKVVIPVRDKKILRVIHDLTDSIFFTLFVCCLVLFDMAVVIMEVYALHRMDRRQPYKIMLTISSVCILGLYMIEAVLKISVQRMKYLSSRWNHFCIFVLLEGVLDTTLQTAFYGVHDLEPYKTILLCFILFRLIRLIRLIQPLLPVIVVYLKHMVHRQLNFGYDVGRGFLAGEEEVCKLMHYIIDNKEIANHLLESSKVGQLEVIKTMGLLQKQHPDVAMSVKSRQAIRSVLNTLRDSIRGLTEDGILDQTESGDLERMVEAKMKKLLTAPPLMTPPPPERLLKNVSWLQGDETLIKFIRERTEIVNYDYGDVIMKVGDVTNGIYIIISGMVRMESISDPSSYGTHDVNLKSVDYMSAGNVIGEMGLLTQQKRQATIWCETSVQTFFISEEDMLQAFEEFRNSVPSLEYRLWRVCALRVSVNVLLDQPAYYGLSKDKVKMHLEPAYLVFLSKGEEFSIDHSMADVILIYGSVKDVCAKEMFHGPYYIPWTATQLAYEGNIRPVIMVVPGEGNTGKPKAAVTVPVYQPTKASNSAGRLCLQHASRTREKLEQRKKNVLGVSSLRKLMKKSREMSLDVDPPPAIASDSNPDQSSPTRQEYIPLSRTKCVDSMKQHIDMMIERDQHSLYTSIGSSEDMAVTRTTGTLHEEPSYRELHLKTASMPSVDNPSLTSLVEKADSSPKVKNRHHDVRLSHEIVHPIQHTGHPTEHPTTQPMQHTGHPTEHPTTQPMQHTGHPTEHPTTQPMQHTGHPTEHPTTQPMQHTGHPTEHPTTQPMQHTGHPTEHPTTQPMQHTGHPTEHPTTQPMQHTGHPTEHPTTQTTQQTTQQTTEHSTMQQTTKQSTESPTPTQTPEHPTVPPTQTTEHPTVPPTQTTEHPTVPPTQTTEHPTVPPTQTERPHTSEYPTPDKPTKGKVTADKLDKS